MCKKQDKRTNAMWHYSSYSPSFGGGGDIYISSDANNNTNSDYILGSFYELPPGHTRTFLVGSNYFKVSDMEVFQVI